MKLKLLLSALLIFAISAQSQIKDSTHIQNHQDQQYPGLGKAASSIFFSEKPWSVSGFGEVNGVNYNYSPMKESLGDMELYYTSLYRLATFFGYRFSDKIIFNSEIQVEYLTDGMEGHTEFNFELFLDFRLHQALNLRVGFQPISIGYINSNDEPLLFYSVNRPEVERLIIPTTWIELGVGAYGQIAPKLNYFVNVVTSLDASEFRSATWVRNGREAFDYSSFAVSPQLIYSPRNDLDLSVSGYFGSVGSYDYEHGGRDLTNQSQLSLYSAYARYTPANFRFLAVGALGNLSDTEGIYEITKQKHGEGQVLGQQVYGGYLEAGVDILHWLWSNRSESKSFVHNSKDMKLPIFVRVEHLNTHGKVAESLQDYDRIQRNMNILAVGANYNLSEHLVLKMNYQFRQDLTPEQYSIPSGNQFEFGLGFEF